ncbi:MAG: ATP-binding protein [Alphaproteobacteria bacterium]|nr:ATP-binding protein [Alphaproteobacteria bacterium]
MSRAEDIFEKLVYFGEDALDEFIRYRQTEELFMDFKQASSTGKHGWSLSPDDRRNLAKCISGFGNSEGGVIVWGVECSRDMDIGDVAKAKIKVRNVHRFMSWVESAISGCTIPSHNKVRNHIIYEDKNGDGYLATYIPKSEIAPLMTTVGNTIYIRSGSNNVPAPYAVIAGMFGRRPQPNVELKLENRTLEVVENDDEDILYPKTIDTPPQKYVKIGFDVHCFNDSNVIARELYLTCTTDSTGGEYNRVRFSNYNMMANLLGMEGHLNLITKPELRLPPRGILKFTHIEIVLSEFVDDDLQINGVIGADGAMPKSFRIFAGKNNLRSFTAKALRMEDSAELLINEFFHEFLKEVA